MAAWDVMRSGRPFQRRRFGESALAECERFVGARFPPEPVAVLRTLLAEGGLSQPR